MGFSLGHRGYAAAVVVCFIVKVSFEVIAEAIYTINAAFATGVLPIVRIEDVRKSRLFYDTPCLHPGR